MPALLSVQPLIAALAVITLALMIKGVVRCRHLGAVVTGSTQTIHRWFNARAIMLASMERAATNDAPLIALRQSAVSGSYMSTHLTCPTQCPAHHNDRLMTLSALPQSAVN